MERSICTRRPPPSSNFPWSTLGPASPRGRPGRPTACRWGRQHLPPMENAVPVVVKPTKQASDFLRAPRAGCIWGPRVERMLVLGWVRHIAFLLPTCSGMGISGDFSCIIPPTIHQVSPLRSTWFETSPVRIPNFPVTPMLESE